jgi:hypothetical protein
MPGIYKLKECPSCGAEHRKRGPYCSRSCGNKRTPTDEHKQKIADANRKHMAGDSDSAEKSKWLITHQRRGDGKTTKELYAEMEEYGVVPPDDLGYAYEKDTDGDIWTS